MVAIEDLALNLVSEGIGIAVTVFIVDRLLKRAEKRRSQPFQKKISSRIGEHVNLIGTWIEALAFEKDKDACEYLKNDIIDRRRQIAELLQTGDSVLPVETKNALIEFDRRLDGLLNMHNVYVAAPANQDTWRVDVYDTMSQVITVTKQVGGNMSAIGLEAWLEMFKEKYCEGIDFEHRLRM